MKQTTTIRRVDEAALRAVLQDCRGTAAELILRLAWGAGLTPEEMRELVWSDVDFDGESLSLPDRSVPLDGETLACLRQRLPFSGKSARVLLSDRRKVPMNRVSIFRCAREALEKGGLQGVTLMGLRQDFILRQLERHGRAYAARVAGVTAATLDAVFGKQAKETAGGPDVQVDGEQIFRIAEEEGASPTGLAIWLTWRHGLRVKELVSLTWEDVELDAGVIFLKDRQAAMDEFLLDRLEELYAGRRPGDDPHVLLTPHSRRPFDAPRLSRVVKEVLIREGLDRLTLRDLYLTGQREKRERMLLRRAGENGYVTREEAMGLFRVGWRPAWELLHRLVQEEKLVRIGARYYLPGTAVPPEQHYEVVRAYLEEEGGAYRKELAELLHIEDKQCGWILTGLVADGKLAREGQRYVLPEEEGSYR